MALRYIVPALAVAGSAAAQCSGTITVTNTANAYALSTCTTFSGSIAIATNAAGDIALDGIKRITGSLEAKNVANMTSLSADSLSQIDDQFYLDNVQILTNLNFPALSSLDTISWSALPNLQGLVFTTGVSQASDVLITNTGLTSLDGINLAEVNLLEITNNDFLTQISMQLGHIGQGAIISGNAAGLSLELPNLIWANNMTVHSVGSVDIASLSSVNGSLGFYTNTFTSLSAPNLTLVGSQLTIYKNNQLTNVTMPELKNVGGGFYIADNDKLGAINGFPRLTTVDGAIDCYGNFKEVVFPKISLVKGAFNVVSTKNINSDCATFKKIQGPDSDIRGKFTCSTKSDADTTSKGGSSGTGSSSSSSSSSSSPATPLQISGATGVLGVVAAIFGML